MGNADLSALRSEILRLSESDRAKLAHDLMLSLDEPAEPDAGDSWDKEILRRLGQVESGSATLIDREEFRRRMRAPIAAALCPRIRSGRLNLLPTS
ncbi:MAG: addiction module protein [Burkholderiales bacterium]